MGLCQFCSVPVSPLPKSPQAQLAGNIRPLQ